MTSLPPPGIRPSEHQGGVELLAGPVGQAATVIGKGPIETLPYRQTLHGMDIGKDTGPTVSGRYQGPFPYSGRLHWIAYRLHDDRADLKKAAAVELENRISDQ